MKKIFFGILAIVLLASCKKNNTNTCEQTMAEIAGKYKLIKLEQVSFKTGAIQDVTATLTGCQLSGVFVLHSDSTATYTELSGCNGSGTGIWNLSGGINSSESLYTSFTSGNGNYISLTSISSWDCRNLVLTTNFPGAQYNNRYTLAKF